MVAHDICVLPLPRLWNFGWGTNATATTGPTNHPLSSFIFLIKLIFQLQKKKPKSTLHPNPQTLPINLSTIPYFPWSQDLIYAKDFMFDFDQVTYLLRREIHLPELSYLKSAVCSKLPAELPGLSERARAPQRMLHLLLAEGPRSVPWWSLILDLCSAACPAGHIWSRSGVIYAGLVLR